MFWSLLLRGTFGNQDYENSSQFPLEDYFHSSLSLDGWGWDLVFTMMVLRSVVFGRQLNKKAESWLWEELLIKGLSLKAALPHSITWRHSMCALWKTISQALAWEPGGSCLHWPADLLVPPRLWTSYALDLWETRFCSLWVTQLLVFLLWQYVDWSRGLWNSTWILHVSSQKAKIGFDRYGIKFVDLFWQH